MCLGCVLLDILVVQSEYLFFRFVNKVFDDLLSFKCWILLQFGVLNFLLRRQDNFFKEYKEYIMGKMHIHFVDCSLMRRSISSSCQQLVR